MRRGVSLGITRSRRRGAALLAGTVAIFGLFGLFGLVVLLGLGTAVSSGAQEPAGVHVVIRDFKVRTQTQPVAAGTVTLEVENRGASTHEFNIDRTSLAADALPLGPDGLTVDEDSQLLHRIDAGDDIRLGETRDITVRLKPGHYILWCNLEGHYLGGMHFSLNVEAPA
jgi:uncharacterized cupredoxin-like copper-binding protein